MRKDAAVMFGAFVTIKRENQDDFSVIMPVARDDYGKARLIRTLGSLRTWLQERALADEVLATILQAVNDQTGGLPNEHAVEVRLEKPEAPSRHI